MVNVGQVAFEDWFFMAINVTIFVIHPLDLLLRGNQRCVRSEALGSAKSGRLLWCYALS